MGMCACEETWTWGLNAWEEKGRACMPWARGPCAEQR